MDGDNLGVAKSILESENKEKTPQQAISTFNILDKFIDKMAPDIESVHAAFTNFKNTSFAQINRDSVENYLRRDLAQARVALQWYNITNNAMQNSLAILSSKYGLLEFIEQNPNISSEALSAIQAETSKYHQATYGLLIERLRKVSLLLQRLHNIISEEVRTLELFPNMLFLEALSKFPRLAQLFEEEREVFWSLVKAVAITRKDVLKVRNLFYAQRRKVNEIARAHLVILQRGFQEDIKTSKNKFQATLLILTYLLGAYKIFTNITLINVVNKGATYAVKRAKDSLLQKEASEAGTQLKDAAEELLAERVQEAIQKFAHL